MAVRPVDPLDLLSVLDIRQVLERAMMTAAVQRATTSERGEILRLAQNMLRAAEAGDLVVYMQNDKLFHEAIDAAAGNPYGGRALEPLQTFMRRAWYVFKRENVDVIPAARQHLALAQAIAVSDTQAAARYCDEWMEHMRKELHEEIRLDMRRAG
jgi:DNA-binding GntR family transcriptional regulator